MAAKKIVWQAIGWENLETYENKPVYNRLFPTKALADEFRYKQSHKAKFSFSMKRSIEEYGMPVSYLSDV